MRGKHAIPGAVSHERPRDEDRPGLCSRPAKPRAGGCALGQTRLRGRDVSLAGLWLGFQGEGCPSLLTARWTGGQAPREPGGRVNTAGMRWLSRASWEGPRDSCRVSLPGHSRALMRGQRRQPQLRDIPQNNWPVLFLFV